jgi:hypothetical protein
MQIIKPKVGYFLVFLFVSFSFIFSCEENGTDSNEQGHQHTLDVMMTHTPNPAIINQVVAFLFEVEDDGNHVAVTDFEAEVEKEGSGNHVGIPLTADPQELGHYNGVYTFTEVGMYEIHFHFTFEGTPQEKSFNVQVQ